MSQDWKEQLNSADPKERAEAIKKIALSGDQDNLQYLKEIVENDPDPRVQDYARKAARHLYGSAPKPAPAPAQNILLRRMRTWKKWQPLKIPAMIKQIRPSPSPTGRQLKVKSSELSPFILEEIAKEHRKYLSRL